MSQELRTNTATRITVGPFLDKTDGITPKVALTVTSEKLTFIVDDAGVPTLVLDVAPTASGGNNDMVHITGDDSGYYDLELTAANVNYLGRAKLSLNDVATHCPVFHEFMIITAAEFDRKYSTGLMDVNVTKVGGTTQTARDLGASVLLSTGTGTGQLDFTSGVVKANLAQILGTALTETAGQIAAAFKKFFNIATPAATMDHGILVDTATNVTTVNGLAANVITAASAAADFTTEIQGGLASAADIADAVWDEAAAGHVGAGSLGKSVADVLVNTAASKAVTDQLAQSVKTIVEGTCTSGSSTTSVIASSTTPASGVNSQFNGRIMIFAEDTTTVALRGQATDITAYVHATKTFTVTALTTAPVSGDTFCIL